MTEEPKYLTTLRDVRNHITLAGQIFADLRFGSVEHYVQITKHEARRLLYELGDLERTPEQLEMPCGSFGRWYAADRQLYLG